jgi:hypothetical protein
MRFLPCNHLGSIGFNQGLFTGRKGTSSRTPWPVCLTWRLCARSQLRQVPAHGYEDVAHLLCSDNYRVL